MPTDLMQSRLITLRMYLNNKSLTGVSRQRAMEYQARAILHSLDDALEQEHVVILNELRRLGFDDLIAEYR